MDRPPVPTKATIPLAFFAAVAGVLGRGLVVVVVGLEHDVDAGVVQDVDPGLERGVAVVR